MPRRYKYKNFTIIINQHGYKKKYYNVKLKPYWTTTLLPYVSTHRTLKDAKQAGEKAVDEWEEKIAGKEMKNK